MTKLNYILADGRWSGTHGIGRFSAEILPRLKHADLLSNGPTPLSLKSLFWLPSQLKNQSQYKVYYSPGFNPVLSSPISYVMTICDLIHLHFPGTNKFFKKLYYDFLIKSSARRANKILTISEFSKKDIVEWTGIPETNVINVSCGVSSILNSDGKKYSPGYPYLLHVGNTKEHKNVIRMLQAFAIAKIDREINLILTGEKTSEIANTIKQLELEQRIIFSEKLSETQLAEYYRGALALLFPSLYEGFGLPPLEAMACGTPALTSNVTSLPEVVGDAAVLIDPYQIDSIAHGIEQIVTNSDLRNDLIEKGFERVKLFSWDETAKRVQEVLESLSSF